MDSYIKVVLRRICGRDMYGEYFFRATDENEEAMDQLSGILDGAEGYYEIVMGYSEEEVDDIVRMADYFDRGDADVIEYNKYDGTLRIPELKVGQSVSVSVREWFDEHTDGCKPPCWENLLS